MGERESIGKMEMRMVLSRGGKAISRSFDLFGRTWNCISKRILKMSFQIYLKMEIHYRLILIIILSLVDFEIPECSEVFVDSNLWADLDSSFFEEPEKESETLDESVFQNERHDEGNNECEGVVHVDVSGSGEGLGENGDLEQNGVDVPIEDSVFQSEVIDGIMPKFELRQSSCDVWKSVPHQNIFIIMIKDGLNHCGPGWWADLPLPQQELRAEVLSEYNLQRNGVFKIQGQICYFNEKSTLVLVSVGIIYLIYFDSDR